MLERAQARPKTLVAFRLESFSQLLMSQGASKGHGVRAARAAKMVTGVDPAAGPSVPSLTVAAGVLKG